MIGFEDYGLQTYEECLDFIKEHWGFNSIVSASLVDANGQEITTLYAVDRLQDFYSCCPGDRISLTEEKIDEAAERAGRCWDAVKISYRLLPSGKRKEPLTCQSLMHRTQIMQLKQFGIDPLQKIFEAVYCEMLNALIEGGGNEQEPV